ncbi:MAG: DUF3054 domain-containing protein [Nocardioides sp.]|nr:DUF3054 domain-containing protein [Nocardioides sp.]
MRWLPLDLVLVVLFAVAGRSSHEEGLTLGGIAHTAWPFVVGLLVGWAVILLRRTPPASLAAGLLVWLATLLGGMVLRVLTDAGTALPFVVVATLVTGALLVGWRLLVSAAGARWGGQTRATG